MDILMLTRQCLIIAGAAAFTVVFVRIFLHIDDGSEQEA